MDKVSRKGKIMIKLNNDRIELLQALEDYYIYERSKGNIPKSLNFQRGVLDKFLNIVGNIYLGDPKAKDDLLEYYTLINTNEDLSITSRGTYLRVVRAFVNWANEEYKLSLPIPFILKENVIKETYTNEELAKLIVKPKKWKNFAEYRNWIIILLLIDTGLRAGSIRNMKVEDVDFDNRCIYVKHTKTRKQQLLPISNTLMNEMYKYIKNIKGIEWLFPDIYGNQLSENGLKLAIRKYNTSRGVNKTSIHLFRHTMARRFLLEMEGNAFQLQKMLGHSTLDQTRRYVAIFDSDLLSKYDETSPLELLIKKKIKMEGK